MQGQQEDDSEAPPPPEDEGAPVPQRHGRETVAEKLMQKKIAEDAYAMLKNKHFSDAAKHYSKLIDRQQEPTEALAYLAMATLLARGRDAKTKAHRFAGRALGLGPSNPLAHAALGRVLEELGDNEKAMHHIEEATKRAVHSDVVMHDVTFMTSSGPYNTIL